MNPHIAARIAGIHQQLLGAYRASSTASAAMRGGEREFFIDLFLSQVLSGPYRFGTGDATDRGGQRSGQLDVVVENPFLPSLPIAGGSRYRLYLAEGIAACIEVKSDVAGQWKEVEGTARQLHQLRRDLGPTSMRANGGTIIQSGTSTSIIGGVFTPGRPVVVGGSSMVVNGRRIEPAHIPMFAVGYRGWKTMASLEAHLAEDAVDGILVLDEPLLFAAGPRFGGIRREGLPSLWAFICCLNEAASLLQSISVNPLEYLDQPNGP